ncbi:energy-coupling factor ABC transporter permease [Aromatoleum sp.]|uniref:energy-coupling factor ABC transporter permease n=1 Tax=Aromatoleum sp. TaxID=2307007 RepID=UPI003917608C
MDIPASLIPVSWQWASLVIAAAVLYRLFREVPWTRLAVSTQLHLLLGFVVCLTLLWSLKAGVKPGLNLHFLGAMAATLMFGPALATVALGLALVGITVNGALDWQAWPLDFLLMAVVPVQIARLWLSGIERHLPAHFFIFIFVIAFVGSAVTVMLQGLVAAAALAAMGAYPAAFLVSDYLPYLLLLGFSEAWLSGAAITLMVVYRPDWVSAFDDRRYLIDK